MCVVFVVVIGVEYFGCFVEVGCFVDFFFVFWLYVVWLYEGFVVEFGWYEV